MECARSSASDRYNRGAGQGPTHFKTAAAAAGFRCKHTIEKERAAETFQSSIATTTSY